MLGIAVDETAILLHPPPPFSRCFNRDGEGLSAKINARGRGVHLPQVDRESAGGVALIFGVAEHAVA